MSRYYFYLIIINGISNNIILLPRVLIADRFNGASMAILLGIPFSTVLLYAFTNALNKTGNLTMAEIVKNSFPPWLQISIMVLFSPAWYISGLVLLASAVDMSLLMVNPQTSIFWVTVMFVAIFIFVIRYKAINVLFGLEIFLVPIIVVILFIYIRSIINIDFNWDSLEVVEKHSLALPTLFSFAATTYTFTGYMDMASYSNSFTGSISIKYLWIIPVASLLMMVFSFIIPIGLLGSEAVGSYEYPLITASDTLGLKTGVIDRVFIIFLIIYLLISIINIIVHWKVSFDLICGFFKHQLKKKKAPILPILLVFAVIPFFMKICFNDHELFLFGEYWLSFRIFVEVVFVLLYIFAVRRQKRNNIRGA